MIECIQERILYEKVIVFVWVFVVIVGCSKEEVDDGTILSVSKDGEAVVQEFNKYLEMEGQDIYIETNLEDVYYRSNGKRYSLKEFVKSDGEFGEITSLLGEGISYDDGGSMLYSSDEYDLSVLMCGTLDGNKDIYVGDYTMYYDNTMCHQTFSESFSFVIKSYVL